MVAGTVVVGGSVVVAGTVVVVGSVVVVVGSVVAGSVVDEAPCGSPAASRAMTAPVTTATTAAAAHHHAARARRRDGAAATLPARAARMSSADAKRAAGSLCIALLTARATWSGTSGRRVRTSGTGASRWASAVASGDDVA